jgi:hypothetical protein
MNEPHTNPNYIFTSFLSISHLFISHDSSDVTFLGCYGNLLTGEIENISVETDFTTLNDLLTEAGPEAEEATEQIAKLLSKPTEENGIVDLCDSGGLTFSDHIFALLAIYNEDEEGRIIQTEEHSYRLNAYIKRQNIIPDFIENMIPENIAERSVYFNALLTMQYYIYLGYRKKKGENIALIYSNLTDPFYFNLAKTQYDLHKAGHTNN